MSLSESCFYFAEFAWRSPYSVISFTTRYTINRITIANICQFLAVWCSFKRGRESVCRPRACAQARVLCPDTHSKVRLIYSTASETSDETDDVGLKLLRLQLLAHTVLYKCELFEAHQQKIFEGRMPQNELLNSVLQISIQ